MSSKDKSTIKLAVGSPDNIQSCIWIMRVHKNSVYLGAKTFLGVFKVSLHESETSNVWRIAFVKELKRDDNESDRLIKRWERPGEFAPGWTPSVAILISSIEAAHPIKKTKIDDSRIKLFIPQIKEKRLIFKVLFSKPGITENGLKHIMTSSDQLVGRLLKKNGEAAWLIMREEDLTPTEKRKIEDVMEKTKINLKAGSSKDSIGEARALLVVSEDIPTITTQPKIIDIELGKENVYIDAVRD